MKKKEKDLNEAINYAATVVAADILQLLKSYAADSPMIPGNIHQVIHMAALHKAAKVVAEAGKQAEGDAPSHDPRLN